MPDRDPPERDPADHDPPGHDPSGHDPAAYGDGFADVYDEWYADVSDIDATVDLMTGLAGSGGRVLELGVGTGRLALPMVAAGLDVTGIDVSSAMLERLRGRDPGGTVHVVAGDMVDALPDGPFDAALVAYNTLFNLVEHDRQQRCFETVAQRLVAGGRFVVEAAIPDDPFPSGDDIHVRSMSQTELVLSVSRRDPSRRVVDGQLVHLRDGAPVRLRPWSVRLSTVAELDAMAVAAGFDLESRWADVSRTPFDGDERHVSVYRRNPGPEHPGSPAGQ